MCVEWAATRHAKSSGWLTESVMPCWARHSIHANNMAKAAVERFPEPVDGAPGVFYTGYHSEKSFGGAAWLITDSGAGNVLVDSPRFDRKLVARVKVHPKGHSTAECSEYF